MAWINGENGTLPIMITASVVSHGHGSMVSSLIQRILTFSEVKKVILTLNTPETIDLPLDGRLQLIENSISKGFAENHNHAFSHCDSEFFCVLNPDISFGENPFPRLIESSLGESIGLVAPIVKNLEGEIEDSVRKFISPISLFRRRILGLRDAYLFEEGDPNFFAEWVGGMCMLFKSSAYAGVKGFDQSYYLYVEDVDICTRLWKSGYKVLVCPGALVFHDARRASRKNGQHLRWHIMGLLRYSYKFWGQLASLSKSIESFKQ